MFHSFLVHHVLIHLLTSWICRNTFLPEILQNVIYFVTTTISLPIWNRERADFQSSPVQNPLNRWFYNPVQSKSIWTGLDFQSGGLIQSISYLTTWDYMSTFISLAKTAMLASYVPRNAFSGWHDPSYDVIGQMLGGQGLEIFRRDVKRMVGKLWKNWWHSTGKQKRYSR